MSTYKDDNLKVNLRMAQKAHQNGGINNSGSSPIPQDTSVNVETVEF